MGLEIVVRPVVFPDIRPQPARSLPPADDPEKGFCDIKGAGSFVVSYSLSNSWSVNYGKNKETKRRVDEARVYQKEDDGTINKENFVDIDVANKIWKKGGKVPMSTFQGFNGDDVVPTVEGRGHTGDDLWTEHYKKVEEKDNIKIRKKNKIIANNDQTEK